MTQDKAPEWALAETDRMLEWLPYQARNYRMAIARALSQAHKRGQESQWQPIETTPKDGTFFDVWYELNDAPIPTPAHRVTDVFWDSEEESLCVYGVWGSDEISPLPLYPQPTHWRPRPNPPAIRSLPIEQDSEGGGK